MTERIPQVGVDVLTGAETSVKFNVPGGGEWVVTRTDSGWTHPKFSRAYPHLRDAMAKARALAEKGGAE